MALADDSLAALDADGALAAASEGFEPREEQQRMAGAVAEAIDAGETLIAEAGTGTGKTFAYLVPALLARRKVIISTGTRTLQDQLYHKDLPRVATALGVGGRRALLKGRSNYLCLYRLEQAAGDGRFPSREHAATIARLRDWSRETRSGDLAEAPVTVRDPAVMAQATSTADNCLGQECPFHAECFLMEARRRAQEADVVVVNHHLLMADWAVREGGFGEVLPSADVYILDEAHQIPETAARFFGLSVSSRQLLDLARDVRAEQLTDAPDTPDLATCAEDLHRAVLDLRLALGSGSRRGAWSEVDAGAEVTDAVAGLQERLEALGRELEPQAPRGKGLEHCARRCESQLGVLREFLDGDAAQAVQWFETYSQSFILRLTPLDIADTFRHHMGRHPGAWVFTSATLSVDGSFAHYAQRLGLDDPRTLLVASPFDYRRQARLLVPQGLPPPNSPAYQDAYMDVAERVLAASRGRAFLLFTSYRALDLAARRLRGRLPYPLFVQGEASQNRLLERFRASGNGVLIGTQSFWEGVDVPGEALSVVMIDRLPFASPADPVVEARIAALRRAEGNPFVDFQLPQAVITLRQGVGRLIRGEEDRGVLVIGDPRLVGRSYGRVFLSSLPDMPLTRRVEDVERFFEQGSPAAEAMGG